MDPPSSFDAARFRSDVFVETTKDHCRAYSVVVDPTGSHAAACTSDGNVHVWSLGRHLVWSKGTRAMIVSQLRCGDLSDRRPLG
jgi:WD40 repeat protein